MVLTPGQEFSHYKVMEPLGQGAMGIVYRARDTRLDRDVALKVIPGDWSEDPERLRRLEREAKVLASLNHAHIAQIHAVETLESSSLLVLELVEGEELAARIGRGALPLDETLTICAQIAEGLESAHEAGVVHRDLKPANVRITPRGVAKVLDFGLARPSHGDGDKQSMSSLTGEGVLVGTPSYMAPEAVRGQLVDRRADIWAFGCILHECLTGERTFRADSLADLMTEILEREPELSRLPANTPPLVRRLVARCLDKNPRTRLQDMGEARIALTGGRGDELAAPTAPPRSAGPLPILSAFLVGALLSLAVMVMIWPETEQRNPLDGPVPFRISLPGSEYDVAVSTGGEAVLFGSDRDGVVDLWRYAFDGGKAENLTQGGFSMMDEMVRNMGFQGTVPWVHHAVTNGVFQWSGVGATPEVLLAEDAVEPDWTRDRGRVVYHSHLPGDPIYVQVMGEAPGEPVHELPPGQHLHYPTWSFDEEWIFYVQGVPSIGDMHLWRMRPDGSDREQLTTEQLNVNFPTPIDEDTLLFLGHDQDGSGPWVWSLDVPTGRTRRATVGLGQYTSLAISDDGRTLVATEANPKATLWQVPIPAPGESPSGEADALRLPDVPSLRALAPRFAGGQLFYLSSLGGGDGLYMVQEGRARQVRSHAEEPLLFVPAVSADGGTVAFVRRGEDHMVLSLLDVRSRQVMKDLPSPVDVRGTCCFSPDGTQVVIGGVLPDGPGLFRFTIADGAWEQIHRGAAFDPSWSPTEDLILFSGNQYGPWVEVVGVTSGGEAVELDTGEMAPRRRESGICRFTPDGTGVVFLGFRDQPFKKDFHHLDLETGDTRVLTDLELRGDIRQFDLSPDGTHIVFDRIVQDSDVVVWRLQGNSD